MNSPLSVLSSWPRLITQVLLQDGIDVEPILNRIGMAASALEDPNAQVSTLQVIRLWQAAVELLGDDLPLRVANSVNAGTFHALGFAMATSETGYDALKRLEQYYPILTTSVQLNLIDEGDVVTVQLESSALITSLQQQFDVEQFKLSVAQLRESAALALLSLCRSFFGVQFNVERIYLNRKLGALYDAYQAQVGCKLIDNADVVQVCIRKELLLKPLPSANTTLAELHDRIVQSYLKILKDNASTQVSATLIKLLPLGLMTQTSVAKAMNISTRSLQRKLAADGTSFREVLLNTRKELALQYLQQAAIPILEIGYRLGFSDPANFTRAFKRWMGQPPLAFREQALALTDPKPTK